MIPGMSSVLRQLFTYARASNARKTQPPSPARCRPERSERQWMRAVSPAYIVLRRMGQTSSKSGVREPLSNARGLYACDLQGNSLRKAMPSALQAGCFGRLPMDRGQTVKLPVRRRPQGWENHPPQSRFLPQSWLRWVRRSPLLRFARRLGLSRAATTFPRNIQLPVLALSASRHKGSCLGTPPCTKRKDEKPKAKTPAVPAKASPAKASVAAAHRSDRPGPTQWCSILHERRHLVQATFLLLRSASAPR
jgi:hypothetical protein